VFRRARDAGFHLFAHAGEEGPPSYVWEALDVLGVERVDHGNQSLRDDKLIGRLARDRVPLTMCPLSNLKLRVVDDLKHHPLRRMMEKDVLVTVNSDDPAYFGGYVNDNFRAVGSSLQLSHSELIAVARNSFIAAMMPEAERTAALAAFDAAVGKIGT
jgi:adenosine deaminase